MPKTFDSTRTFQTHFSIKVVAPWNVNKIVKPYILHIERQRFFNQSFRSSKINKIKIKMLSYILYKFICFKHADINQFN